MMSSSGQNANYDGEKRLDQESIKRICFDDKGGIHPEFEYENSGGKRRGSNEKNPRVVRFSNRNNCDERFTLNGEEAEVYRMQIMKLYVTLKKWDKKCE